MGATCCCCGLCGKAGLLPALQRAATGWTQYPDGGSHGPQASGTPPARPVSAAFNHSSFWLWLSGPSHSMQMILMQQRRHTQSLSLGRGGESHVFTAGSRTLGHRHHHATPFITDRYESVFDCCRLGKQEHQQLIYVHNDGRLHSNIWKIKRLNENIEYAHLLLENSSWRDTCFEFNAIMKPVRSTSQCQVPQSSSLKAHHWW